MGIFPIAMNVLQFWLIDSIVKFKGALTRAEIDDGSSGGETPYTDDELGPDANEDAYKPDIENGQSHHQSNLSPSPLPGAMAVRPPQESSSPIPASSASSRTITAANVFRRSPPPSPSVSSMRSYGSNGSNGLNPQFASSSRCSDQSDVSRVLGGDGDGALTVTPPSDGRGIPEKWESWKMTSPPSKDVTSNVRSG